MGGGGGRVARAARRGGRAGRGGGGPGGAPAAFEASYGDDFQSVYSLKDYVFSEGLQQTVVDPVAARLQPADLLVGRSALWGQGFHELEAYGGGKLLGVPLVLLALAGVIRRPRLGIPLVLIALLGVLLALGSYLSWGETELRWSGAPMRLPFLYVNRLLAYLAEPVNFPVRFLALTAVACAGLAALALRELTGRWRWVGGALVMLAVLDVQARQLLPWPLPSFQPLDLPELEAMQADEGPAAGDGSVLDLSGAFRHDQESRFVVMSAQLAHQQPIQAVPIDRLEFHVREGRWFAAGLHMVPQLQPLYMRQVGGALRGCEADRHVLSQAGFDRVLVISMGGRDLLPTPLTEALTACLGEPGLRGERLAVYSVVAPAASDEQAAAWEEAHRERAQQAQLDTAVPGPAPVLGPGRSGLPTGELTPQ